MLTVSLRSVWCGVYMESCTMMTYWMWCYNSPGGDDVADDSRVPADWGDSCLSAAATVTLLNSFQLESLSPSWAVTLLSNLLSLYLGPSFLLLSPLLSFSSLIQTVSENASRRPAPFDIPRMRSLSTSVSPVRLSCSGEWAVTGWTAA